MTRSEDYAAKALGQARGLRHGGELAREFTEQVLVAGLPV